MATLLRTNVHAFMAIDRLGNEAPILLTIHRQAERGRPPPVDRDAIDALECMIEHTGFANLASFSIQAASIPFMEARVTFIMDATFEQEDAILMARFDSIATRDAFFGVVNRLYDVTPFAPKAAARDPAHFARKHRNLNGGVLV